MLANLDNEVIFKKAFTDKVVFRGFVEDILGIQIEVDKIETEKQFDPKIGNIDFKLDIFAESTDKRVIIEIQRIEYDYNFDRFLHYFIMSIAELQRKSKEYGIETVVYGIIVLTAPYTINDKTGRPVKNEVLISKLNPHNLKGEEIEVFGHRLVFLNSYHKDEFTPPEYRDWLDLVYESIHHPEHPKINLAKSAIKRAAKIIDKDNLTPEEREQSKINETTKVARRIYENKARQEGKEEGKKEGKKEGWEGGRKEEKAKKEKERIELAKKGIRKGYPDEMIADLTGMKMEEIDKFRREVETEK
jgi:predicted transposase/invertase (TIGR01784 family)